MIDLFSIRAHHLPQKPRNALSSFIHLNCSDSFINYCKCSLKDPHGADPILPINGENSLLKP
jgi:hypothetical protein